MARSTAERPSAEQQATLTDEELQKVAAGADQQAAPRGIQPRRRPRVPDTSFDPSSDGDMPLT